LTSASLGAGAAKRSIRHESVMVEAQVWFTRCLQLDHRHDGRHAMEPLRVVGCDGSAHRGGDVRDEPPHWDVKQTMFAVVQSALRVRARDPAATGRLSWSGVSQLGIRTAPMIAGLLLSATRREWPAEASGPRSAASPPFPAATAAEEDEWTAGSPLSGCDPDAKRSSAERIDARTRGRRAGEGSTRAARAKSTPRSTGASRVRSGWARPRSRRRSRHVSLRVGARRGVRRPECGFGGRRRHARICRAVPALRGPGCICARRAWPRRI
jgi:hypothetical protein